MARKTRKERDLERQKDQQGRQPAAGHAASPPAGPTPPPGPIHQVLYPAEPDGPDAVTPPGPRGRQAPVGPVGLTKAVCTDVGEAAGPSAAPAGSAPAQPEALQPRMTRAASRRLAGRLQALDTTGHQPCLTQTTCGATANPGSTKDTTGDEQGGRRGASLACADSVPPHRLPPWEKVLWKLQPYPDNHVDRSFLQDLVVNARLPIREYRAVVLDAMAVSQQVSLVAAAALVPVHLASNTLSVAALLALDAALLLLGYSVCAVLGKHRLGGPLARGGRQAALLVGGVYCLSPLLRTLAATISLDSVIALAVLGALLHLFLHDYNFVNSVTQKRRGSVALAAAMLSAVLVSSAMPSELHVFAQVLFALELLLLSPFVWRYVRAASQPAHVTCAALLALATTGLCWRVSRGTAAAYAATHFVLTLGCPAALIRIQKFKAHINGPWDEAMPHIPAELKTPAVVQSVHDAQR